MKEAVVKKRTAGMLSAKAVYAALRAAGQEKLIEQLKGGGTKPLKLSRKDIKKIEADLAAEPGAVVVLKRKISNPSDFEFVHSRFVTIAPRRHVEKEAARAKANGHAAAPSLVG